MKNKILLFCLLTVIGSAFFAFPSSSFAQTTNDPTLNGLNESASYTPAFQTQIKSDYTNFLQTKVGQIIGVVLSFVGALFLLLMIYAGILWMTAQGNEQQVTKAKQLMFDAAIGMIIIFAAYALTTFIGGQLI